MPHRTRPLLLRVAATLALIAALAVAVPAAATDRVVVVQPGDTLSQIALENGVSLAWLQALNGIANPDRIYAGQRLRVSGEAATVVNPAASTPRSIVHVVASGENLTFIARRYGSSIAAIATANGIANPSFLRVGQKLTIPGSAPSAPAPAPVTPAAPVVAAARVHVVASGENLTFIARRYGSSIAAIATANGIANPSFLRVGQKLTIPGSSSLPAVTSMPSSLASLVSARAAIGNVIRAEAKAQGVPVAFALAVAWHESGWRAGVVSRAGAVGVMQLTPATADWVAVTMLGHSINLYDAGSNVQAGVTLLRHYLDRYHGDRALTLAAYYQGQTAADRYGVYGITRPYIASITALEALFAG